MRRLGPVIAVVSTAAADPGAAAQQRRKALLRACHKAARDLGWDEEARRDAQAAFAGKESLKDFTAEELAAWAWELKRRGARIWVPEPPAGERRWEMISPAQMAEIERLAYALDLPGGPDGQAMRKFCEHTARVSHPRLLSRAKARDVISGLRRWLRHRERDGGRDHG